MKKNTPTLVLTAIATLAALAAAPIAQAQTGTAASQKSAPAKLPAATGVDISAVPISTVALGDFPFITLPQGYTSKNFKTETKQLARYPFWVKDQANWVEGKFYLTKFTNERGTDFSDHEFRRNLEAMIGQMGGVKLSQAKIPNPTIRAWGPEINQGFIAGMGDVYNQPATTYLVRRNDGNIWIHLTTHSAGGSLIVGQAKPERQTYRPPAGGAPAQPPSASHVFGEEPPQAKASSLDLSNIPVSTAALGEFPYLSIPQGYTNKSRKTETKQFARYPFWVNGQEHWVEGKFYLTSFSGVTREAYSEYEARRNMEAMIEQMGGVKLSHGKIPNATIRDWGPEINQGFLGGMGDPYNNPVTTYLVRRNDGNIWIHLATNSATAAFIVGKEAAFEQTAHLLPASELKKQIDATGKVALQVHFAVDKTDILPESRPQIAQVVELLQQDPALKLHIHGHTDSTGSAAHNQTLSEGRAQSVMAALTAQGIAANRLSAKGFGDTQPVASNSTAEGKAQNRRVELVKQ